MLRSLYLTGTGMLVQRKKMEVLVNDAVNVETTGYKSGKLISKSFDELLIHKINDPSVVNYSRQIGPLGPGIHIDEIVTDFSQGPLEETERPEDLAIAGEGFFVIRSSEGERYTRDGSFFISVDGYLTNSDGWPVMGRNGNIFIDGDFSVDSYGNIYVDDQYIDQILLVDFESREDLRKTGDNLYVNYGGSQILEANNCSIKQGYLENSNLDVSKTMVDMLQISRAHEISQRILRMLDSSLEKAVNEVGRVR